MVKTELQEHEKLQIAQRKNPALNENECIELFNLFFSFICASNNTNFWWNTFKQYLGKVFYPVLFEKLGLYEEDGIM